MNKLRRPFAWGMCAAALVLGVSALRLSASAEEPEVILAPANPADDTADQGAEAQTDLFVVPDGSAADMLAFIDRIAHPQQEFESEVQLREYLSQAATAISEATDKVLAGNASEEQQIEAVHWKLESFKIRQQLGDPEADQQASEFLAKLQSTASPHLAQAVKKLSFLRKLRDWRMLDPDQRTQVVDDFIADMKAGDMSPDQIFLFYRFVDLLSDTPDSGLASRIIDELLPRLKENTDPQLQRVIAEIEGIGRRVNLPGNKIEVEGKFLDGKPIDWESYRGKVVLLDFWATDCGYCLAEVPNLMENYRLFHDKGFDIVGVSMDSKRAPVEQYMEESGVPWPTLFQENPNAQGWEHPVAEKYAITAIPRLILVDQQGKVVSMNARGRNLTAQLQRLLGAPAAQPKPGVDDEASSEEPSEALTAAPAAP